MNGRQFLRWTARHAPPPIELDFVPIRRLPGMFGWGLLAAGVACVAIEAQRFMNAHTDLAERAQIVDALRSRQAVVAPPVPAAAPPSAQEVDAAQRVAARLEADWSALLAALARVSSADVAWVEVELVEAPAPGERSARERDATAASRGLRLVGEARSLEAVLAALDRLRHEPVLVGSELVSHEAVTQDGARFVRFIVGTRTRGSV